MGEYQRSLGNRAHDTPGFEFAQVVQEIFFKHLQGPQVVEVIFREGQMLEIIQEIIQAGRHGITAMLRQGAKKIVKGDVLSGAPVFPVPGHHC
ncbi:MAG: hypothetical protein BWX80_03969 [Candidatus Hydrogenedentes bacterium ADurb.Bin101]|nr:MAG: hypothetical protein BWX80_03969 [Candidatus Hydrogenedentes bacterium ADurb.Bin101]